jgi:hypothetical protein
MAKASRAHLVFCRSKRMSVPRLLLAAAVVLALAAPLAARDRAAMFLFVPRAVPFELS